MLSPTVMADSRKVCDSWKLIVVGRGYPLLLPTRILTVRDECGEHPFGLGSLIFPLFVVAIVPFTV